MRIPTSPPDFSAILLRILNSNVRKAEALVAKGPTDSAGRYLPWEELRFKPTPDGLTAEEVWAGMRYNRASMSVKVPFRDTANAHFWYCEPECVRRALHAIDTNARGAIRAEQPVTTPEQRNAYLIKSLIEEPFNSSVLEGATATREEAKALIREAKPPRTKSERMILNNYRAMEFIRARIFEPLSIPLIQELHRIVTHDTLDSPDQEGRFRKSEERAYVEHSPDGEILHEPPQANDLPERMKALITFANQPSEAAPFVHPVVRAIILHFMLAYEHPFVDGNGRTARALFYWCALRHGYWLLEYASISKVINKAPIKYAKSFLYTETDGADLTYFIIYHLKIIEDAIADIHAYIASKVDELNQLRKALDDTRLQGRFNHRQIALVNEGVNRPGFEIEIQTHERTSGVSYLTARKDLEELVQAGLADKDRSGHRSVYRMKRNLLELLERLR